MESIDFATLLEEDIEKKVKLIRSKCPEELTLFLQLVDQCQENFLNLLRESQQVDEDVPVYPQIQTNNLVGNDEQWSQATHAFAGLGQSSVENLTWLWMIYVLFERSAQYYQQAVANCPYPAERLFLKSLVEVKSLLKRRIDGAIRILYNEVWASVGFAPFSLGKD